MQKIYVQGKKNAGKYALVDDEDYEKVNQYKWYIEPAGYLLARYYGNHISMHVLIMGRNENGVIDHKNHNPLDNQKNNLRFATYGENVANSGIRTTNKSGYKGVSLTKKGKYIAQVKGLHIGSFDTAEEAAEAYDYAALKAYGEYAYLNLL